MKQIPLYPLLLERQLVYRMWGGQHIAEWLNVPNPPITHIGETWEVYDTNRIRNGDMAGATLAEATAYYQHALIGTRMFERYGADFPLLLKFIDANDKLSIQVHPDDAYAHLYESATGFHGKTEAWYVLRASPHADIVYGLKQQMSRDAFVRAVEQGTLEHYMQHVPVAAGDVIYTPPGTLHAINHELLLFEVQQKSDLTYRVYDYQRCDPATGTLRTLHLDKALDVIHLLPDRAPKTKPVHLTPCRELLLACRHFALELWYGTAPRSMTTHPATLDICTVIEGTATLTWETGTMQLVTGDSVLLPAMLGMAHIAPATAPCRMLHVYVPDVEHDIVAPLHALGVTDSQLAQVVFER